MLKFWSGSDSPGSGLVKEWVMDQANRSTATEPHSEDLKKPVSEGTRSSVPFVRSGQKPRPSVLPQHTQQDSKTRRDKNSVRFSAGVDNWWVRFKRQVRARTPSTSSIGGGQSPQECQDIDARLPSKDEEDGYGDSLLVDDVVVDRSWSSEIKISSGGSNTTSLPDADITPEYSGDSPPHKPNLNEPETSSCVDQTYFLARFVWHATRNFFYPAGYSSPESEAHYRREDWFVSKPLAVWSSVYLVVNWAMGLGFATRPFNKIDIIFFYGFGPLFCFPIPFMVIYNWPHHRRLNFIYQIFVTISIWMWSFYVILYIYLCGFYHNKSYFTCGPRDFLNIFFYTIALQTIALFGLKLDRFPAAIGALMFFILTAVLIIPVKQSWIRIMVNFAVFNIFLIYVHYKRDLANRRTHSLRTRMKLQYRATQRAQINERRMSNSRWRLVSYVFHEVRVPLNAASIAVQNIAASGTIAKEVDLEFSTIEASLNTMSKVLNDVLDFNRIDTGHFESVRKPFVFHKSLQTIFNTVSVTTAAKGLKFVTIMDDAIDRVARREAYKAMGQDSEVVDRYIDGNPGEGGVVAGDESRLRQVIHNLASNACKFTPSGGTISITTRLISTATAIDHVLPISLKDETTKLSSSNLSIHNYHHDGPSPSIVIRIEVTDTGCGIARSESRKLFSPFHQTEKGREQGPSSSGLGLSLVRSIVKLLGGRLGYSSLKNSGSTFWVELPFGVGEEVVRTTNPAVRDTLEPAPSNGGRQQASTNANELFPGSSRDPEMSPAEGSSSPPIIRLPIRTFAVDPAPTSSTHLSSGSSLSASNPMTLFDRAFSASSSQKDLDETPIGLSVLIVDDDEVTRRMMSRLLLRFGCKTAVAENGRVALEMMLGSNWVYSDENGFTRTNPDASDSVPIQSEPFYNIVFMDNQMPLMSGIKAVKQLRRLGRADYVVGLTGNALLPDQNEYLEAGADLVLTKPVFENVIKDVLKQAEKRRRKDSEWNSTSPTKPD